MRKIVAAGFGILVAYSAAMAFTELRGSAQLARIYLEDPAPARPFAGIHTALSAALLAACALTFAATRRAESAAGRIDRSTAHFLDSQILLFFLLAFDETFRVLPALTARCGLPESAAYLALGVLEVGLLWGPGRLREASRGIQGVVLASALCYAAALGLDDAPARLPLRECAEELPKVWGGALFLGFAWRRLESALDRLAFPGIHGAAFQWARSGRAPVRPRRAEPARPDSGVRQPGARKRSGAPVPGTGAPEPDPKREGSGSSAAPPRKLLSH